MVRGDPPQQAGARALRGAADRGRCRSGPYEDDSDRHGRAAAAAPAYTPLQVAEQAALVDQLSGGRLLLGVAPGWQAYRDYGFENFGFGPTDLQPMMDESLEVIGALWSQERVTFTGSYYRYLDAACYPRPRQARPPVLIGGITRRAMTAALSPLVTAGSAARRIRSR